MNYEPDNSDAERRRRWLRWLVVSAAIGTVALRYALSGRGIDVTVVERGTPEEIRQYVHRHPQALKGVAKDGRSLVLCAMERRQDPEMQATILRILGEAGADFQAKMPEGLTPLQLAVIQGQLPAVKALLEFGADWSVKDEDGRDVLALVHHYQRPEMVAFFDELFASGYAAKEAPLFAKAATASPAEIRKLAKDLPSAMQTALLCAVAARNPDPEAVRVLVRSNVDPLAPDVSGKTPWFYAAKFKRPLAIVLALTSEQADVNRPGADGWSPWLRALRDNGGDLDVATWLYAGADPLAVGPDGRSAYALAESKGGAAFASLKKRLDGEIPPAQISPLLAVAAQGTPAEVSALLKQAPALPKSWLLRIAAAGNPDPEVSRTLAMAGGDLSAADPSGRTPLMEALRRNQSPEVVATLLSGKASPNAADRRGTTALMLAAQAARPTPLLKLLLEAGANPAALDNQEDSALNLLLQTPSPSPTALDLLFPVSAAVVARANASGETPLYWLVARNGTLAWTEAFLRAGAKAGGAETGGKSPLLAAVRDRGDEPLVALLLKEGANPNVTDADGLTPLMYAAQRKSASLCRRLLDAGALPALVSPRGESALTLALRAKADETLVAMLLESGVPAEDAALASPPLELALANHSPEIAMRLLEHGANPNTVFKSGKTPLGMLAEQGLEASVLGFIQAGADPLLRDGNGRTLQENAWATAQTELAEQLDWLQDNGYASVGGPLFSAVTAGTAEEVAKAVEGRRHLPWSLLLMAAAANTRNPEVIELLLRNGADPAAQDNRGWTAISYAMAHNRHAETVETLLKLLPAETGRWDDLLFQALAGTPAAQTVETLLRHGANPGALNAAKDTPLLTALRNPRPSKPIVQILLEAGADPNAVAEDGYTPLLLAARQAPDPEIIALLMAHKASLKYRAPASVERQGQKIDLGSLTALSLAVVFNPNPRVAEALLTAGSQVNAWNEHKRTALSLAAQFSSQPELLRTLMARGAYANALDDQGMSPLMYAAAGNPQVEITALLIHEGASLSLRNNEGLDALALAAAGNPNAEVAWQLATAGAGLTGDQQAWMPLLLAVRHNTDDMVRQLVRLGADVNARTPEGRTILHLAVAEGLPAARIRQLLAIGADAEAKDAQGRTALMLAFAGGRKIDPDCVQALLETGAALGAVDNAGNNVLHLLLAAATANPDVDGLGFLKTLVQHGADPQARNVADRTPLMQAAAAGSLPWVQALLEANAPPNDSDKEGWTALALAAGSASEQSRAIAECLLQHGADPNGGRGALAPLLLAASQGHGDDVALLLKAGANPNVRDPAGKYPLELATDPEARTLLAKVFETGYAPTALSPLLETAVRGDPEQILDLLHRQPNLPPELLLFTAASHAALPAGAQVLVEAGAPVNACDARGWTPLDYALKFNRSAVMASSLVALGAAPDARDSAGNTSLHRQLAAGATAEAIRFLLANHADVNALNAAGRTPLTTAIAVHAPATLLNQLIDAGANLDALPGQPLSPLAAAVANSDADTLAVLVKRGANTSRIDMQGSSLCHAVVKSGDLNLLDLLGDLGIALNTPDGQGWTPLMHALERRDVAMAERLLEAGQTAATRAADGTTPLYIALKQALPNAILAKLIAAQAPLTGTPEKDPLMAAVECGSSREAVPLLLEAGAAPTVKTATGKTALLAAAAQATPDLLERLLAAGADPMARSDEGTALDIARKAQNTAAIRFFEELDQGGYSAPYLPALFDIVVAGTPEQVQKACELQKTAPWTALLFCASDNNRPAEIAAILLAAGASPNSRTLTGRLPLAKAVAEGKLEWVRRLLAAGASVNASENGQTLPELARARNQKEVLAELEAFGRNGYRFDEPRPGLYETVATLPADKLPPLPAWAPESSLLFAAAAHNPDPAVVDRLVALGAKPAIRDCFGQSTLHLAIAQNPAAATVASRLLKAGADPNAADGNGVEPLALAVSLGKTEVAELLLAAGGNPEITDAQGRTLLMQAVVRQDAALLRLLLAADADVNATDIRQKTALILAAEGGAPIAILQALLDGGADPAAKDISGSTALDYARPKADAETLRLLIP